MTDKIEFLKDFHAVLKKHKVKSIELADHETNLTQFAYFSDGACIQISDIGLPCIYPHDLKELINENDIN